MGRQGARAWYASGVGEHYAGHAASYRNPHAAIVERLLREAVGRDRPDLSRVLDLAAGSGEVSGPMIAMGAAVEAIDPYTGPAYESRIGQPCEAMTFEQIATGSLRGRGYSLIVCSFAMHLCAPSLLPALSMALAEVAPALWVLTPHKRPVIREAWGWKMLRETLVERVRLRCFQSLTTV